MPTPNDDIFQLSSHHLDRPTHTTCPPDYERPIEGTEVWRAHDALFSSQPTHRPVHPPNGAEMAGLTNDSDQEKGSRFYDVGYSLLSSNASSPMPIQAESKEAQDAPDCQSPSPSPLPSVRGSSSTGYEFSSVRVRTRTYLYIRGWNPLTNRCYIANPQLHVFLPAGGQQISWHANVGPPDLQCRGRHQACGYE